MTRTPTNYLEKLRHRTIKNSHIFYKGFYKSVNREVYTIDEGKTKKRVRL